jgi:energy-coupling factor transporter ATP-binding protein EcfA2
MTNDRLTGALEENVLAALCYSRRLAPLIASRVPPSMFSSRPFQKIAEAAISYIERYKKPPGIHLSDLLEKEIERQDGQNLIATVVGAMPRVVKQLNEDFIEDNLNKFLELQTLSSDLTRAFTALQNGDPAAIREALLPHKERAAREQEAQGLVLTGRSLAERPDRLLEYLWEPYLPKGALVLFVGHAGAGKSQLALHIACVLSVAGKWPDGSRAPKGKTLFASVEDDPDAVTKPRVKVSEGDVSQIIIPDGLKPAAQSGDDDEGVMWTVSQVDALDRYLTENPGFAYMVIDPLDAFIGAKLDAWRPNEVYGALLPLAKVARKHGITIVALKHFTKSGEANAAARTLGSAANVGIARAAYHVAVDPLDAEPEGWKKRRLLLPFKSSWEGGVKPLAFRLQRMPLRVLGKEKEFTHVVFDRGHVDISSEDVMRAERGGDERGARRSEAFNFLMEMLGDGPAWESNIADEARRRGITTVTLNRAKRTLGVRSEKGPKGSFDQYWYWRMKGDKRPEPRLADRREETEGSDHLASREGRQEGRQGDHTRRYDNHETYQPINSKKHDHLGRQGDHSDQGDHFNGSDHLDQGKSSQNTKNRRGSSSPREGNDPSLKERHTSNNSPNGEWKYVPRTRADIEARLNCAEEETQH